MKNIVLNKIQISVYHESEIKHPIRGLHKFLCGGLVFYAYLGNLTTDEFLVAAGHQAPKIDLAVPQEWFDKQLMTTGIRPEAYWTYERDSVFGEPLFLDGVRSNLIMKIREKVEEYFINYWR